METIIKFMQDHKMISWNGIEKELQLNRNTLKQGKAITKHQESIKELLNNYGLNQVVSCNSHNKGQLQNTTISIQKHDNTTPQPISTQIYHHNKHILKILNKDGWKMNLLEELPPDAQFLRIK